MIDIENNYNIQRYCKTLAINKSCSIINMIYDKCEDNRIQHFYYKIMY